MAYLLTCLQQFMLYMQVSNDYEAERAIKRCVFALISVLSLMFYRLRTRIALAQNSEASLAQKQTHCECHVQSVGYTANMRPITDAKVVQAFQSAMELLGNV